MKVKRLATMSDIIGNINSRHQLYTEADLSINDVVNACLAKLQPSDDNMSKTIKLAKMLKQHDIVNLFNARHVNLTGELLQKFAETLVNSGSTTIDNQFMRDFLFIYATPHDMQ